MFMADMLSRLHLPESGQDIDFSKIIHAITLEEYLHIPIQEINTLKQATTKGPTFVALRNYIDSGWNKVNQKILSPILKVFL